MFWMIETCVGAPCSWFEEKSAKIAAKRLRATERYLLQRRGRAPDLRLRKIDRREFEYTDREYEGRAALVELFLPAVEHDLQ
jgi:hypothetical protein